MKVTNLTPGSILEFLLEFRDGRRHRGARTDAAREDERRDPDLAAKILVGDRPAAAFGERERADGVIEVGLDGIGRELEGVPETHPQIENRQ